MARWLAGMCHRETGFIQEIAQEIAMRKSQNVWVDGSLRDGEWFSKVRYLSITVFDSKPCL